MLSILTTLAIAGVLVQMGMTASLRSGLVLNLLSWAVVLVLYAVSKSALARRGGVEPLLATQAHRLLVFANEEGVSGELLDELWRIEAQGAVTYSHAFPPAPSRPGGRS